MFAVEFFSSNANEAPKNISSFGQQKNPLEDTKIISFCKRQNLLINADYEEIERVIKTAKTGQQIIRVFFCGYLQKRMINQRIADKYFVEISSALNNRIYRTISLANSADKYEFRSKFFKEDLSPGDNNCYSKKNANGIAVFEEFFDPVNYQTSRQNQEQALTKFLLINPVQFCKGEPLFTEKFRDIYLCLTYQIAERKYASCQKLSNEVRDQSKIFKGNESLNEWVMNCERLLKLRVLKGRRF